MNDAAAYNTYTKLKTIAKQVFHLYTDKLFVGFFIRDLYP